MSHGPLRTLAITDFRGIRGSANPIALDAPVVLIHGTNGAGKSTVMAALELALTGATSGIEQRHHEHLVHRGRPHATIKLVASEGAVEASIDRAHIHADPLLDPADRRVFAERCYLEQRTLGRLIEVYEASNEGFDSRLTAFVKDLLGLDELDALIEGLKPVMDKRNVKSLVPAYRNLERERDDAHRRIVDGKAALTATIECVRLAHSELAEQLAELGAPSSTTENTEKARGWIASETSDARGELAALRERRLELAALARRVANLDESGTAAEIAEFEEAAGVAARDVERWRSMHGAALDTLLSELRTALPALPDAIGSADPAVVRAAAVEQVVDALERVTRTLELDAAARAKCATLEAAREAAQLRLASIDEQLATSEQVTAAEELGRALSALVPHIHSEDCPVCGRDYSEVSHEPLTAHLASRIASLSNEAERLRELAKAHLEALSDLRDVERQLAESGTGTVAPETQRDMQALDIRLRDARKQLSNLADRVDVGGQLMRAATERERELIAARGRDRASSELRAELAQHASALDERPPPATMSLAEAIAALLARVDKRIEILELRIPRLAEASAAVEHLEHEHAGLGRIEQELERDTTTFERAKATAKLVEQRRKVMRTVRDEARAARTALIRRVFTDSLNRTWSDLFVRLAPMEAFVPVFRVPEDDGHLVAVLETAHRDGSSGGPPAAMLSAGNLNTAALTLFLALNLSVEQRLPWLLLDDPVQSMDEVHVAQFAALLRTLTRDHGRRVIIAVHERALFDYLALELSPARPDDGLITVELTRPPDGRTDVVSQYHEYVEDRAFHPA